MTKADMVREMVKVKNLSESGTVPTHSVSGVGCSPGSLSTSIESGSSMQEFLGCEQKYKYRYEDKLTSNVSSDALDFGSIVHALVEGFFSDTNTLIDIIPEMKARRGDSNAFEIDMLLEKAHKYFDVWREHYREEHATWNMLETEGEWKFNTSFGLTLAGKRDGYVEINGEHFLYELKTATFDGRQDYLQLLTHNHQIFNNVLALQAQGKPVSGIVYDIIYKPRNKDDAKAIADDPAKYLQRVVFDLPSTEVLEGHKKELKIIHERMENARQCGTWLKSPGNCKSYNKVCPFFAVCAHQATPDSVKMTVRDKKLPELSEDTQKENE